MPKIKAVEMKDAKVSHISLVDRGANRSPFKVIKQEKSMKNFGLDLDLSRVFSAKKAEAKPEIVAIVTMKEDGTFEVLKGEFEKAGFSVTKSEDQSDNSVVFAQADDMGDTKDHTVVRIGESAALVVKAFRPYNMDMDIGDGTTFADVCKAQGFYPGVGTMVDVLRSSVIQCASDASDPAEAASAVKKMFSEAGEYASSMVSQLPAKAFKLESIELADPVSKGESQAASGEQGQGAAKTTTDDQQAAGGATLPEQMAETDALPESVEKADMSKAPAGVAPADWAKMDDAAKKTWWAEKLKAPAKKAETAPAATGVTLDQVQDVVAKSLEAFGSKVAELMAPVTKSVEGMSDRIAKAEQAAAKATEAVNGTVLGSEAGDQSGIRKSEAPRVSSVEIDTAFAPRRRAVRA